MQAWNCVSLAALDREHRVTCCWTQLMLSWHPQCCHMFVCDFMMVGLFGNIAHLHCGPGAPAIVVKPHLKTRVNARIISG
jgi:hypothetical protein